MSRSMRVKVYFIVALIIFVLVVAKQIALHG